VASGRLACNSRRLLNPDDRFAVKPLEPRLLFNGDSIASATPLPLTEDPAGGGYFLGRGLGSISEAVSQSEGNPDYWSFTALAGDAVSVSVDTPDSDLDPEVLLLNAAGGGLVSSNNEGPDNDAFISRYVIPSSGTYYVRASKYYYNTPATTGYQVRVDLARGATQLESDAGYSNDSVGGANAVTLAPVDTHRTGTIVGTVMSAESGNVDEDYFNLGTIQAGETVFLSVRTTQNSLFRPILEIRNASNQIVSIAPTPTSTVARVDVSTPGTYYAVIVAQSGQGPMGQYLLDAAVWPTGELNFADLAISAMTAPTLAASGEMVHLAWTVGNFGSGPTDVSSWFDRVVLSSDNIYGNADDAYLASIQRTGLLAVNDTYDAQADVRIPLGIAGNYHFFIKTDETNGVFEYIFKNNNIRQSGAPISVVLTDYADLEASDVIAPVLGVAGQPATITWKIRNQGTGVTGDGTPNQIVSSWIDRIVVSPDLIFGNGDDRLVAELPHDGLLSVAASYDGSWTGALPAGLSGSYNVFVFTDYGNAVYEYTNTLSNLAASDAPIAVATGVFADLTVSTVTAPASAVIGEQVTVSWTVTNTNNAWAITPTSQWYDHVLLSRDAIHGNGDDRLVGQFLHNGTLAVEASYIGNGNITIPGDLRGAYHLFVVTDASNAVYEFVHEGDNVSAAQPINVTAPDLTVESVVIPASATFDQPFNVTWSVRNIGDASATVGWNDRIWLSTTPTLGGVARLLATKPVGGFSPLQMGAQYAQTASVTLPLDVALPAGIYYIIVQADALGQQLESTETNNNRESVTLPVAMPPLPDLTVNNITAPIEALSGQQINVTWTVSNMGDEDASGSWNDKVYLSVDQNASNDQLIATFPFTGTIPVGSFVTRTQAITIPIDMSGARYVAVATDSNSQIFEPDENNTAISAQSVNVILSPFPNLQVAQVIVPPTAFSGQTAVVEWIVHNVGTGSTSAPLWRDALYLSTDSIFDGSDLLLGSADNPSYLAVGDSYQNGLTVTLPNGIDDDYYFIVHTDANGQVFELANENDNRGGGGPTDVNLTPPPDLQVVSVIAPALAFSGQPININWTVENQGPGAALATSWFDRVYMSADNVIDGTDRLLATVQHPGTLPATQTYTNSADVMLPIGLAGELFLIVQTDSHDQVFEYAFESNNTGFDTTTVNLTPPPDLEVTVVDAPTMAFASHNLIVQYTVANNGATETPYRSWEDRLYLSTDGVLNTSTDIHVGTRSHFDLLEPGEAINATFSVTLPDGLYGNFFAFVVTDFRDDVFEVDNSNNSSFDAVPLAIESRPADLQVSSLVAPAVAAAGGAILVDWTVVNLGNGDTAVSQWSDRLIISKDAVVGNGDDVILFTQSHVGLLNPAGQYSVDDRLVQLPFTLDPGNYSLFLISDISNQVFESPTGEANNINSALPITVTRQTADLRVMSVTSPSAAISGQGLIVSWTVQNMSVTAPNSNTWTDTIYISADDVIDSGDLVLGSAQNPRTLDSFGQYTATRTFNLPVDLAGVFFVLVRADSANHVLEDSLEGNNDRAADSVTTITLSPVADLDVVAVEAPPEAFSGQMFDLSWTVRNVGGAVAQGNWHDAVYLSLDQVFDRTVDRYLGFVRPTPALGSGLMPGDNYTASGTFNLPTGLAGLFYVFVVSDGGNVVYERGVELNNVDYDPLSMVVRLTPPADLVVGDITIPANAVPGQDATIAYTINNQGVSAALGSWFDSIYISADDQWDISDAFWGRVLHTGTVQGGASYPGTLTAPLPGVLAGDYKVIIRTDIRNNIIESNETNNVAASLTSIQLDVEQLTLGMAGLGSLSQGNAAYYRVDVPTGETLVVSLNSASTTAFNELYIRFGQMPTRSEFDAEFSSPQQASQEVVIPTTEAGSYYVLAYGAQVPDGLASYQIEANLVSFGIRSLSTDTVGNEGETTLIIKGAKFAPDTQFVLTDSAGTEIFRLDDISDILIMDAATGFVTLPTAGLSPGTYHLLAENNGVASPSVPLAVVLGGADIAVDLVAPSNARPGQQIRLTLRYGNNGLTDTLPPLIYLRSLSGNELQVVGPTGQTTSSTLVLLGVPSDGPSGVLRPGSGGQIEVITSASNPRADIQVDVVNPTNQSFDWDRFSHSIGITDTEFTAMLAAARDVIGETYNDVVSHISEVASRASAGLDAVGFDELLLWSIYAINADRPGLAVSQELSASLATSASFDGSDHRETMSMFDLSGGFNPLEDVNLRVHSDGGFRPGLPTTVIVHGWNNSDSPSSPNYVMWMSEMAEAVTVADGNRNVIVVDWGEGADRFSAPLAAYNIEAAGKEVARKLAALGAVGEVTDFIGHSFGTYVSNVAAGEMGGANRLTALDPASRLALHPANVPDLDFTKSFEHSVAYHSGTIAGSNLFTTADYDFLLQTPYGWWQFSKQHGYAIPFQLDVIVSQGGPPSNIEKGFGFDGKINLNGTFEPGNPLNPFDPRRDFWQGLEYARNDMFEDVGRGMFNLLRHYRVTIPTILAYDPNDIVGPQGFGDERWVSSNEPSGYAIRFENQSAATAPAQRIRITQTLDADFDVRSFRLGDFGFGDNVVDVPENRAFYTTRIDLTATRQIFVDVVAGIDVVTREAFWEFTSIDPGTGEVPVDALAGFLPPNSENAEGEGFVSYSVRPKTSVQTGAVVDAQATIVFDINEPIDTPAIFNTLDTGQPDSQVAPLPTEVSDATFTVSWSGQDESGGSGLADFTVFVAKDGGPFEIWLPSTTLTAAEYVGQPGAAYAFYSTARDNAGNKEAPALVADAQTVIIGNAPEVAEVLVGSSLWSTSFLSYLDQQGLGAGGYAIPVTAADQLRSVPWTNIDKLMVRFTEDVVIPEDVFALVGVRTPLLMPSSFNYDPVSFTATWTFSTPLTADKWLLRVLDTVTDASGNPLDGDWTTGSGAAISGDGSAGGDFTFRFNVLPGDVNRDNTVLGDDVIQTRNAQFRTTAAASYSAFHDFNGSGAILGDDVILVRNRQFTLLPTDEPSFPSAPMTAFSESPVTLQDIAANVMVLAPAEASPASQSSLATVAALFSMSVADIGKRAPITRFAMLPSFDAKDKPAILVSGIAESQARSSSVQGRPRTWRSRFDHWFNDRATAQPPVGPL